jgi:dUTP pyrophosphatase
MKTNCDNCNVELDVKPSRLKNNQKVCCSRNCSNNYRKTQNLNTSCEICSIKFKLKPFHKKRYKGPFTCSRKCRGELLKTIYIGNKNPNHKYKDSLHKFFVIRCNDIKNRANRQKLDFNLTPEYLYSLYLKQNGLCSYSGIPMKITSTNFKIKGQADIDTLSVDKIIPENGYIEGNITFCCNGINKLKGNDTQEDLNVFLNMLALKTFGTCHIKIKKLRDNATMPFRAKLGDGGYDITAAFVEDLGDQIKVYTGISCQPDPGWILLALPRSSICKKGLRLSNSVGLIDNQYTGEIMAVFDKTHKEAKIEINERIIQIVPMRTPFVSFEEVDTLYETDRGSGGFGSSNT